MRLCRFLSSLLTLCLLLSMLAAFAGCGGGDSVKTEPVAKHIRDDLFRECRGQAD